VMPMCDFEIVGPRREKRLCRNPSRWVVEYITPDDGKTMRRRVTAVRCFWHTEAKFFPPGSSGFTTVSVLMAGLSALGSVAIQARDAASPTERKTNGD
jgi:hypothetical protein